MKALILSGGKGTRLRPLTYSMAKQLVPVANKPVLFYGLEAVRDAGIREIGIVVGDTQEAIRQAVGDGSAWDAQVTYIPQAEPLGLAHAVKMAQPFLGDEPFVVYLGDNLVKSGIVELVSEFEAECPDAIILLAKSPNPQEFGVAELEGGRVIRLEEKPKAPKSDFALVGVYIFGPAVFGAIDRLSPSPRGEYEITDAIQRMIDDGRDVRSHIISGWWKDTGDLEALLDANRLVLESLEPKRFGAVDKQSRLEGAVSIGEGSSVQECIIRGPVVIGCDCRLTNAVIGPFTSIGDGVVIREAEIEYSVVLPECRIDGVRRCIERSLLGRGVKVRRADRHEQSIRLMLGDTSEIELP